MSNAAFVLPSLPINASLYRSATSNIFPLSLTSKSTIPGPHPCNPFTSQLHFSYLCPPHHAFLSTPCAVLWFRIGNLRLADNLAVTAASIFRGTLLPVVTVQYQQLRPSVTSCILDLSNRITALGSRLIVRIVRADSIHYEIAALQEIISNIRANHLFSIFLPQNEYASLSVLRRKGIRLKLFTQEPIYNLTNAPKLFPQLPEAAKDISSNIFPAAKTCDIGESFAWKSLRYLLSSRSITLSVVCFELSEELRLGCLTERRIISEFCRAKNISCISQGVKPNSAIRFSSNWKSFFSKFTQTPAISFLSIAAYDVNGGDRRGVEWDEESKAFVLKEWEHAETERRMQPRERIQEFIRRRRLFLTRAFFPEDVTPDYYSFTAWRFAQRCVSATIGVFGTTSLLLALGIRSGRIGQAAVVSWVLKEGLGRVGKMVWAGSMGKDFDVDPKRWRFRSALLYAFGNGLEIVTRIFPASFLVFATAANSMKQVSMLTSSATRNAMYRSFGGRSQNIANITAKGEAQIVVADLIGMSCGIRLSKVVNKSKANVIGAYALLTLLDIFGIYMELRQVIFRTLNAERSTFLVNSFIKKGNMLTPSQVSPKEHIFLKPIYLSGLRLSSIAKAARNPEELNVLLKVFRREHFLVSTPRSPSGGPCRLVLRRDASNEDVLRAILLVGHVHESMRNRTKGPLSSEEQEAILRYARKTSKRQFASFLASVREAGWNTDNLLFSTLKRRGYWGHEGTKH